MKKVIIGIHGLGNKPPEYLLEKWWKEAIVEGLNTHGIKKKLPEFKMVYWADILHEKPLDPGERDRESPYYLDEPYTLSSGNFVAEDHSFRMRVNDFITNQLNRIFLNPDKTLNYTFITDYILQKYFSDLEAYYLEECEDDDGTPCKAKELIRQRIKEAITKYSNYEIMIIAHSMGSIINLDVLNFVIPDFKINTLVTIGSPLGMPVVVARIAAEQRLKLNGKSILTTPEGITSHWYNMADITDKVALNYKLSDDFTQNRAGVAPEDFLVLNDYEIDGQHNPHKSFGYLRTPEFANILSDFIGDEEMNFAQKILDNIQKLVDKIKKQLTGK